jgi:hypothetical protein
VSAILHRPVLTVPTVTKDVVTCPSCIRLLGQRLGSLFVMQHKGRILIGPQPALLYCEECRGTWRNPDWDFTDSPEAIWATIQHLPYLESPPRNWAAVPRSKRPAGWR